MWDALDDKPLFSLTSNHAGISKCWFHLFKACSFVLCVPTGLRLAVNLLRWFLNLQLPSPVFLTWLDVVKGLIFFLKKEMFLQSTVVYFILHSS